MAGSTLNAEPGTRARQAPVATTPRALLFAREPGWQFSAMLGFEMLYLFVAVPLLSGHGRNRDLITFVQFCLVAVSTALVAKNRLLRTILAGTFAAIVFARLLPGHLGGTITLFAVLLFNLLVTGVMILAVLGPGEVNHHRIAGAIFIYLNIALVFALLYSVFNIYDPGSISGLSPHMSYTASHMTHFSFETLTSIGSEDIHVQTPFAKSLADIETIIGQLFPAILLSRLVGLHVARRL